MSVVSYREQAQQVISLVTNNIILNNLACCAGNCTEQTVQEVGASPLMSEILGFYLDVAEH